MKDERGEWLRQNYHHSQDCREVSAAGRKVILAAGDTFMLLKQLQISGAIAPVAGL